MLCYTVFAVILVAVTSVHCAAVNDGRGVSAGQQCRDKNYNAACRAANPADRCSVLKCTYTKRGDIHTYEPYSVGPARQGTSCGDKKICVNAKCVDNANHFVHAAVKKEEEYDCGSEDESDESDESDDSYALDYSDIVLPNNQV